MVDLLKNCKSIWFDFEVYIEVEYLILNSLILKCYSIFAPRGALQPSMREILSRDVTWCNVTNMSTKNNSESEYYGGDLVTWCNVTNMSEKAKNNSESEYYGEILSRHVTLLTCRQKIIVKVNLMGEIL